jgi:hypothetical protein
MPGIEPRIAQPHHGSTQQKYERKQVLITFERSCLSYIIYTCHVYVMFYSSDFTVTNCDIFSTLDWLSTIGGPL